MSAPTISRRSLLAVLWLAGTGRLSAQVRAVEDRGIGGTGITSDGDDRGIGGTGIVGVIQRFGSIVVNGERIGYPANVPVRIDGEAASVKALRIGQMARVVARRDRNGALITRRIDVVSEVVGPVDAVKADEISVLGQRVRTIGTKDRHRPGTRVAVFGLRRNDGVIVASLIEPRSGATVRVAGVLERGRDRQMRIGGLVVEGANGALMGRRIVAEGRMANGVMRIDRARPDDFSDLAGADRLLIEAYVRRTGDDLQLGSGYVVRDLSRFQPSRGEARVVVNATFGGGGRLQIDSIRSIDRFPGSSILEPHGPGGRQGGGPFGTGGESRGPAGPTGPGPTIGPGGPPAGAGNARPPAPGGHGGPGGNDFGGRGIGGRRR
jgi:hypothetical protein